MKEIINDQGLTNMPSAAYPNNRDIIMAQEAAEMSTTKNPNQQSTGPEHAEAPQGEAKPVSPEGQAAAKLMADYSALPVELRRQLLEVIQDYEERQDSSSWREKDRSRKENRPRNPQFNQEAHSTHSEINIDSIVDDKTKALMKEFIAQGGSSRDKEKLEKLKEGLVMRKRELNKARDAMGDTPETQTEEGQKKVAEMQKSTFDLPISQIDQIFAQIAESEDVPQEKNQENLSHAEKLFLKTQEFVEELKSRGHKISDINDFAKLDDKEKGDRAELVLEIREAIEQSTSLESSDFPAILLRAVRYFRELREELISDILFKSFGDPSETNEYEVNLYADSHLATLMGFLDKDDNDRYKQLFTLRTAARFFQHMNSTVLIGKFDRFGEAAENINYQHFEKMRDIRGSGAVMRLFEQAYKDCLAENTYIPQEKINDIHAQVEEAFRRENDDGLIDSEFSEYRDGDRGARLEDWEIRRALAVGRTFMNITLRAAENIATGQPRKDGERYASPPQEDMVRILNWNQWLLWRFEVGGPHGEEFRKMSTDRWEEFLRYKGAKLNKNKILQFGGVDVRKMEEGGQYRTSGIFSGWRLENMAFGKISFEYKDQNGQRRLTVAEFRKQEHIDNGIKKINERIEARKKNNPNGKQSDWVTLRDQEEYARILMPVVDNLNVGLSMLIKNSNFGAQDNPLGYVLRTKIWEKVARTNMPLMIDYLSNIEYANQEQQKNILGDTETTSEDRINRAKSIKQIREEIVPGWEDSQWKAFRNKMSIRHERMIQEGMGKKFTQPLQKLSPQEQRLCDKLESEGLKLASHLADIAFAYTPFMNDMPFESFNYAKVGQTFYKRRSTSDLGGFNKGQQGFSKLMDNPGGLSVKEALEAMAEVVGGVRSPEGPRAAQEANFPVFSAWLDVVMTDPIARQSLLKMLLEATQTKTSLSQRWSGIKADSLIESEAASFIDSAIKAGVLSVELGAYMKKEKKLTIASIFWMLFRDVFIVVPAFAAGEVISQVKGK